MCIFALFLQISLFLSFDSRNVGHGHAEEKRELCRSIAIVEIGEFFVILTIYENERFTHTTREMADGCREI